MSARALWLSQRRGVGVVRGAVSSKSKLRSQTASREESEAAMYSASVVESATIGCFAERQLIAPPLKRKA